MKRCPKCDKTYTETDLNFCLDDGEWLVGDDQPDEPQTAILSEPGAVATGSPASEAQTQLQYRTTDKTAILPNVPEAQPQDRLSNSSEKPSISANRAAKPLLAIVAAALLLVGGFFGYKYFTPTKQIESIAVMPFVNESGNADVEYISDGMTETLISSLSQLPNLNVKARTSVFRYKGKELVPKLIGQELRVEAILTGRFVQRGNDLDLYIELIDTETESLLWKGNYNRTMSSLITLQSDIAKDVSSKLKTKLSGADEQQVAKTYTENPEAYQLYLKGLSHWNKRTRDDLKQAIAFFQQAVDKDPAYAKAYGGIAMAYDVLGSVAAMTRKEFDETKLKAKAAAQKALELDSNLPEAYAVLAEAKTDAWDFAGGERDYKRSIELNPNFATAHQWYSELLSRLGRHDEALAEITKAYELDPFSRAVRMNRGLRFMEMGRYDEAIQHFKDLIETEPDYPMSYSFLAYLYMEKGMYEESFEPWCKGEVLLEIETEASCRSKADELRKVLKQQGAEGFWKMKLEYTLKMYERGIDTAVDVASMYARLGDKDRAFEWLEKAFAAHDNGLSYLKIDYAFKNLRDDPRYKDLLKRMGLPE